VALAVVSAAQVAPAASSAAVVAPAVLQAAALVAWLADAVAAAVLQVDAVAVASLAATQGGCRKPVETERQKSPWLTPHASNASETRPEAVPHRRRTIDERPGNGKGSWTDFPTGGKSAPQVLRWPP
jgi:hypothetical protein